MSYLKEDEKIHRKFEEDDAILQAQSNGQEALIDNFQCYKTGYNKGKAEAKSRINDTAKQIFAELDAIAWQQIEPDNLEKFYEEFSKAKDKASALEIAQKFSIIGFSAEKYDNIKKKFSVLK